MKIAVRGGHNEKIRGTNALINKEKIDEVEIDRAYYPLVIKYLRVLGHDVLDVTPKTTDTKSQDLVYGVSKANTWGADLFISCHVNSYNGSGYGCEVVHYPNSSKGKEYASNISASISKLGFRNRGAKADTRGLYELNKTKMTAVIVEPFFLDNEGDVNIYKRLGPDALAKAIVEGITGKILTSSTISANKNNPIAFYMQKEIKNIQGLYNFKQDGIATEELINKLPDLKGYERRGIVTIMQRILILKGFLSRKSATGIIGPANRNAINRFKESVAIPTDTILIDRQTWRKLLEY